MRQNVKDKKIRNLIGFIVEKDEKKAIFNNKTGHLTIYIDIESDPYQQINVWTNTFHEFLIRNIKIQSEYSKITEYIYVSILNYANQNETQIILTSDTIKVLEKENPIFFKQIEDGIINETNWNEEYKKIKSKEIKIIDRIIALFQSTNVSLLEMKVYIYLLGCQVKRNFHFSPELYFLNYEAISNDLAPPLAVNKKYVIKAIDRLKTKGLIKIKKEQGISIFEIVGEGPADLNFGYIVSNNMGDNHD